MSTSYPVEEGTFRADLYYRLNVFPIRVPALRERSEDIPLLVKFFVLKHSAKLGKKIETFSHATLAALQSYARPGNVRELENVIERALILSRGPELDLGDWHLKPAVANARGAGIVPTIEEVERAHVLRVLERTGWRVSGEKGAARLLGLKPTTLEARMKRLGIARPS